MFSLIIFFLVSNSNFTKKRSISGQILYIMICLYVLYIYIFFFSYMKNFFLEFMSMFAIILKFVHDYN